MSGVTVRVRGAVSGMLVNPIGGPGGARAADAAGWSAGLAVTLPTGNTTLALP